MTKIAVVTSNFGGFDVIKEIPEQSVEFKRFIVDETSLPPGFLHNFSNRHKGQHFKMLYHRYLPPGEFDWIVHIDGSIQIHSDTFIEMLTSFPSDVTIFMHPDRSTIRQEAEFIEREIYSGNKYLEGKYRGQPMIKQVEHYEITYPKLVHNQLCATTIFARRVTENVNMCFEDWWSEYISFSNMDQLSFPIAMRGANIRYLHSLIPFVDNELFSMLPHKGVG